MSPKRTAFMRWIDGELRADRDFARRVDELVNEMRIEQERGLSPVVSRAGQPLSSARALRRTSISSLASKSRLMGSMRNFARYWSPPRQLWPPFSTIQASTAAASAPPA